MPLWDSNLGPIGGRQGKTPLHHCIHLIANNRNTHVRHGNEVHAGLARYQVPLFITMMALFFYDLKRSILVSNFCFHCEFVLNSFMECVR